MTREEAIQALKDLADMNVRYGCDDKWITALQMAIEALQNEETLKTQLANCHREILRLLDFSDMTESPDDDIEPQNDVTEVVRCKDCKWQKFIDWGMGDCLHPKGSRHIAYDNHYCSYGERREE